MPSTLEKPQIEKEPVEQEIRFYEIAELEHPLEKILEKIGKKDFDLIIGDDASGRIPTLILSKFFKAKAEKEGGELPQTIFVTSSLKGKLDKEHQKELKVEKKKKILELLVTVKVLEKLEEKLNADIVYGFADRGSPFIYQKHKLSGVERKKDLEDASEIHSWPIKKPTPITKEPSPEAKGIQKNINLSREDANIIADRLIEKFGKN